MPDAPPSESIDGLLEWLSTAAPIEAMQAAANRRANAEFHARLARQLLTLALLGEWRLGHRQACAEAASRLLRLEPDSPVVARLRRERPDIARSFGPAPARAGADTAADPTVRLAEITHRLAQPLARNDLTRFAQACREAAEELLPIALG